MNFRQSKVLSNHTKPLSCVKFSSTGILASASGDNTICIWNTETEKCVKVLTGHTFGISDIAWSCDSQYLVSASDDTSLKLYDISTGSVVQTFLGHSNYAFCVSINAAGTIVASGSFDESVIVWDVRSGRAIRAIPAHAEPVSSVDFHPTSDTIVSGSYDGVCRIWDIATGQMITSLPKIDELKRRDEATPISFVKFTPNGRFVLISTLDSKHKLYEWEGHDKECKKTYEGHTNTKFCSYATFSALKHPDRALERKFVVSGSEDHKIYIWDLQNKNVLQVLEGHTDAVLSVACHPSRNLIASCGHSNDLSVRLWESV